MESKNYSTRLLLLKLALIAAGLLLSNHEVISRLEYFIRFGHYFPLLVFVGIWGLAVLSVLYVSFTPREGIRTFWVIVIGLSTLLGDTWYQLNGDFLSVADLDLTMERLAMAAANEIDNPDAAGLTLWDILGSGWLTAFLSTGLLVSGMLIQAPGTRWLQPRMLGLFPAIPLGLVIALVYYVGATNGRETRGMPGQYYSVALITAYATSGRRSVEKAEVEIPIVRPAAVKHIVLIIDESVAGDFIDLNVPRQVTPFLASSESGVINFGLAVSATNCSIASNAVLRLGANPDRLGQPDSSITNNPSIWKYATAAGFETNYINVQSDLMLKLYYINSVELSLIDHMRKISRDVPPPNRDFVALEYLEEILSRDEPQFVLINKRGVYQPYYPGYPEEAAIFTPELRSGQVHTDRNVLFNTYKNSIRWSVDRFFEELFRRTGPKDFVIIYTSDHGQNLLDDGRATTHCRRVGQNLFEAVVPLLAWTDNEGLRGRLEQAARKNMNRASHFQVFPSVLLLMGYDLNGIRQRYFETLFDTVESPPGFATGSIMGRFGAKPVWHSAQNMEELER
jgi:hypothetical protein